MVSPDSVHAGMDKLEYDDPDSAGSRTVVIVTKTDKTKDTEGETHA